MRPAASGGEFVGERASLLPLRLDLASLLLKTSSSLLLLLASSGSLVVGTWEAGLELELVGLSAQLRRAKGLALALPLLSWLGRWRARSLTRLPKVSCLHRMDLILFLDDPRGSNRRCPRHRRPFVGAPLAHLSVSFPLLRIQGSDKPHPPNHASCM